MSLTLILTRHAKSSWHDPALDDFDRPLNDRGRRSAQRIGDWLTEQDLVPDEVIVSGARRTVDTWALISERLPTRAQMHSDPALYHASAPSMMAVARSGTQPVLMIIGHNPGIAHFAAQIVHTSPAHADFDRYPTCATTVMQFAAENWKDIDWGQGRVQAFVVPKELA